ncbi:hypothetical protein P3L10_007029 [Capsicum annuum]
MRVEGKYLVHVAVFHPQFIVCHFSPSSHTVQTPLQSDNFPQLTAHFSFLSLRQFRPASGRPFRVTNIVWSKSWGSQIHQYLYYRSVNPPPRFGYSSGRVDDSDVSSSSGNSLQPLYITLPNLLQKPWKENGGCGYFRWIDPKPSISVHQYPEVESSLMIRYKDGENLCDRLKQKHKDVE